MDETNKFTESRKIPIDISQIEKELSNSLRILESGLTNLDIEAAHYFNSGDLKNSFSLKNENNSIKTSSTFNKKQLQFLYKASKVLPSKQTNDISHLSHTSTEVIKKNLSVPPDLTFSFYSSTDETIVPSTSQKCQIKTMFSVNNFDESSCSNDNDNGDIYSNLDEILNNSTTSTFSIRNNFESEMRNVNLVNETERKKETTDQFLQIKNDIVLEMNDLVESLLKIDSALNDLDKEAAHILNPGCEVSYSNLFINQKSSHED